MAIGIATLVWVQNQGHGAGDIATVSVRAGDRDKVSQAMAQSLLASFGAMPSGVTPRFRPIDDPDARADIVFRVNGSQDGNRLQANVAVISGRDRSIVWSRDFAETVTNRSGLEARVKSAAGRLLDCASDAASSRYGKLNEASRGRYINACAALTETNGDTQTAIPLLRQVTRDDPSFAPAWAKLLIAEVDQIAEMEGSDPELAVARHTVVVDLAKARQIAPDLPEAAIVDLAIHPERGPTQAMATVDFAKTKDPKNITVLLSRSQQLQRVGRMDEALDEAATAARLDPLSPLTRADWIASLIYSGRVDFARRELALALAIWPDVAALTELNYVVALRYGDFENFSRNTGNVGPGFQIYVNARRDPSRANLAAYLAFMRNPANRGRRYFAAQGLGEMNRPDEFY